MRNVSRPPKPDSLRRNRAKWTTQLVAAARTAKRLKKPIPKHLYHYNQPDVRAALKVMYDGLCCYCEARIGHVAFEHIEHRRPKTRFPQYTYDWNNLNLACPKCNIAKGEKWTKNSPILDATVDIPIEAHLTYEPGDSGVRRWPLSLRGETTIVHADLDREALVNQRNRIVWAAWRAIREIRAAKEQGSPDAGALMRELQAKTLGEYGSLFRWILTELLPD